LGLGLTVSVTLVEQVGRWATGGPVNVARLTTLERAGSFAVIGLLTGLILGTVQWLVLRRSATRAGAWAAEVALALASALVAASLVVDASFGSVVAPAGFCAFAVLSGGIFGVISGLGLRSILSPGA
jgi:hypothetical protein